MENNALLGTTHKLSNSNGLSSLQSSIVCPWVGPRTPTLADIDQVNTMGDCGVGDETIL